MKCKACKNEIPDGSLFCMYCGEKLIKSKAQKEKEASIPKPRQQKSGDWIGQIMVDGKRHTVKGKSIKEYEAKAKAVRAGIIEARENKCLLLEDAITDFLKNHDSILDPSTIRSYKSYSRNRFQSCMLWNIHADNNWQAAINAEAKLVSAKTVRNAWGLITSVLHYHKVSVPDVKLPRKQKSERAWLDYRQIDTFLQAIRGSDCELPALLALHSMRLSELIAITPERVDLTAGEITVRGARVLDEHQKLVYKELNKTEASFRTIPIVIPRLRELLTPEVMSQEYICDTFEKRLYDHINAICKKADLPKVGVHGLRHSFASLAFHLGWTKLSTQKIGGWANSRIVEEIYTHNADLDRDIATMRDYYEITTI